MDEEEQKRQAAAAAFRGAIDGPIPLKQNPNAYSWSSDPSREALQNGPIQSGSPDYTLRRNVVTESEGGPQSDAFRRSVITARNGQEITNGIANVGEAVKSIPTLVTARAPSVLSSGASDAFRLLDEQEPGPLEYDPATAAGLPQDTQDEFRRNWDDNLSAARRAVEAANGPSKEDRDALAIYTDHLVQMADDYQAQRRQAPQTAQTAPVQQAGIARTMSAPAQQQFVPLVTDDDYLAAAKRSQAEKYGEDPFDFL